VVLHTSIQVTDKNLTKQFLDFKTRTIFWLLGVEIDIKKIIQKFNLLKQSKVSGQ
jgi:hypothetical protein